MRPLLLILPMMTLLGASQVTAVCTDTGLTGIPIIELTANHPQPHGRFAVMLAGDGGWRRVDVRVTNRFRAAGIPVVGFLTPDYFKTRRTAEESACALERVIRHYQIRWKRDRVILVGYSRGADIMPFLVSRLPAELLANIDVVAFLGLESTIDFRYHPSWIPFFHPREQQYAVSPELEKLRGMRLLCVYGSKEKNSLCKALDPAMATIVREPGAHHFAGKYDSVADEILRAADRPR